tara:strand:+ start:6553 stop:7722 length:1170 start_codon:yes stop_codon:yes gene_type:complete
MAIYGSSNNIRKNEDRPEYLITNKSNDKKAFEFTFLSTKNLKSIKVSLNDRLIFFRQLSVILKSGVPLAEGLKLLSINMSNKSFGKCISNISDDLRKGMDLSSSLKEYPRIFDSITIGLIEAGETGGVLSDVLERIALLLEAQSKLKGQITSALVYPLIVLCLAVSVSLALLIFIVPTFQELFNGLGAELPALTLFLLKLSKFVTSASFFISAPLIIFSITYLFKIYYATRNGRLLIDNLILRIPIFGKLILLSEISSLSDTLSTLINSGVPMVEALEKCEIASGSQVIKNSIVRSIKLVKEGRELSYSMSLSKIIPKLFISMLKIGEETGELSFMLVNLTNFYKREVDETVTALTKAMEPAVIFVVSGIVGTIVIALYLPMFSLLEKV